MSLRAVRTAFWASRRRRPPAVTNSTAVGFRSFVGQSNSLVLGAIAGLNGATADVDVGIGTANPIRRLHIKGDDPLAAGPNLSSARIENTSLVTSNRHMLTLVNKGAPQLIFDDATRFRWQLNPQAGTGDFVISRSGSGVAEMVIESSGDVTIAGTLTQSSDRHAKHRIKAIDPEVVLEKALSLGISEWSFKRDDLDTRHLGPMAQEFRAAFGLGESDRRIAPLDVAGVALASIQALSAGVSTGGGEQGASAAIRRDYVPSPGGKSRDSRRSASDRIRAMTSTVHS